MTVVFSMCLFLLVMSISLGPVNMVILSSGVNFGVRQSLSLVSGATIGLTLLLVFIGFGFI